MGVRPDKSETSPDGRLRADFTCTSNAGGASVETPCLVDTRSGRTLLALGTDWHAQVFWGEPGRAELRVAHYPGPSRIWRVTIDADRGEARIDQGDAMPLSRLATALAWQIESPPDRSETSPDGRLRVDYRVDSGLMSHEIDSPALVDVASGEPFFSMGPPWSATTRFGPEGVVTFSLRRYPDGATIITVVVDTRRREGRVDGAGPVPVEALPDAVRKRYETLVPAASERSHAMERWKTRIAIALFLAVVVATPFLLVDRVRHWLSATSPAPAAKPLATVPKPTTVPIPDYRPKPDGRG